VKLSNIINLGEMTATAAAELLKKRGNTDSPPQPQQGVPAHKPGMPSMAANLGKNGLINKLKLGHAGMPGASTGPGVNGLAGLDRNSLADRIEGVATSIEKNHKGPLRFLGVNTQINLMVSMLDVFADIVRKGEKRSGAEQVAVDYHDWKNGHPYNQAGGVPFKPSAEQVHYDLNARPDLRLRLMRQSSWKDSDLQLMKQAIDDCMKGMNNPRTCAAAIDKFNKGPYAVHCGPINPADPSTMANYATLSKAIGDDLARSAAGGQHPQANTGAGAYHTYANAGNTGSNSSAHAAGDTGKSTQAAASEAPKEPKANFAFPNYDGPKLRFSSRDEAAIAVAQLQTGGLDAKGFTTLKQDIQLTAGAQMKAADFDKKYGNLFGFSFNNDAKAFGFLMLKMPKT
jgi:hypothetical protein